MINIDKLFSNNVKQDYNPFDINKMTEDEKKEYIFTQINTKINRDTPDKTEFYLNKVHQELYGSPYKYPPTLKKKRSNVTNRVKFANRIIALN
jgi:hypothetical protein